MKAGADETITACFDEMCARMPDNVALRAGARELTYAQLSRMADGVAGRLAQRPRRAGEIIGVWGERSPEMIAAWLGVLRARCAYLPLDPALPDERLRFMVSDGDVATVVSADARIGERLNGAGARPVEVLPVDGAPAAPGPGDRPPRRTGDVAYVIYTSGSTGRPKGVMVEDRSVVALARNRALLAASPDDVFVQLAPCSADPSVFETWTALLNGATLVIPPAGDLSIPDLARLLVRERVSVLRLVAPLFAVMVDQALDALRGVRLLISGGDRASVPAVKKALAELSGTVVVNGYGPTEATVYACCHRMTAYRDDWPSVPIGSALDGVGLMLLDDAGAVVTQPGVEGEIHLSGVGLARGYLNRPSLTAERFVDLAEHGGRHYRTGDIARWLPDGTLEFVGRRDDQVKIRGFRVEIGEIEAALRELSPAADVAVVAAPAGQGGNSRLAAFVAPAVPSESCGQDPDRLRRALAAKLPAYMVPATVAFEASLPKLPNGKIDRRTLSARAGILPDSQDQQGPATERERQLASVWQRVLRRATVGRTDNFFVLGGDSLSAMVMTAILEDERGWRVPFSAVLGNPTIAELARWMDREQPAEPAPGQGRRGPGQRARLSPNQEALWFEEERDGAGRYEMALSHEVAGAVDVPALRSALQMVAQRHELLRSVFEADETGLWQRVADGAGPCLEFADLRGLRAAAAQERARALLAEERSRPLSLRSGPLLRMLLIALPDERWTLHTRLHHIAGDDWSLDVLWKELSACYEAARTGRAPELPALPLQFADYAELERMAAARARRAGTALAGWRSALADYAGTVDVPVDFPRPAVFAGPAERLSLRLDAPLFDRAAALCREQQITRFNLAAAALSLLLSRHARSDDVCIGTPVARRERPGERHLIGYCLNMVALRIRTGSAPTGLDLLRQVHKVSVEAFARQDLPFPWLVRELGWPRDASRTPVFQVAMTYQARPPGAPRLDGVIAQPTSAGAQGGVAKFDLALAFTETGGALEIELEYCAALFERATAARMLDHLAIAYRWLVESHSRQLRDAVLSGADEQRMVCLDWNQTGRPFPDCCLHEWVESCCQAHPDEPAVVLGDQVMSRGALSASSDAIAAHLMAAGVEKGDRVAVCLERSPQLVSCLVGVMKAGAAYVPLDPDYPAQRLSYIVADVRPAALITSPAVAERALRDLPRDCALFDVEALVGSPPSVEHAADRRPEPTDAAYIIYTSGSTGRPKGAVIEHRAVVARLAGYLEDYPFAAGDVWSQFASAGFDMAIFEQVMPLVSGGTSVICPEEIKRDHAAFVRFVNDRRINVLVLAPSFLRALNRPALPTVRFLCTGGEAAYLDDVRHYARDKIYLNGYGPTETTICVTTHRAGPDERGARLPIGRPLSNTQLWVVDEQGRPLGVGIPGELWAGGAGLARGYWNNPELTAAKFVTAPFGAGARVYKTGDLVRWRHDGTLDFLGRIDDQVKIRGYRVELGEIEAVLASSPGVAQATAVLHQAAQGAVIVGVVVASPGNSLDPNRLRGEVARRLPAYMVPSTIVRVNSLPLNEHQKLDRKALARMAAQALTARAQTPLRSAAERSIADIWREMLGVGEVGADSDFFELGGDSLLVVQMLVQVETRLGRRVPMNEFLAAPTVEGLARCAERSGLTAPGADAAVECAAELLELQGLRFGSPPQKRAPGVLVTGPTGFIGSYLVREILETTDLRLVCLARADDLRTARERVLSALCAAGAGADIASRVSVLAGDLQQPQLGLPSDAWATLADQIGTIFHVGARVHHFLPYARLRPANVGSTLELLRLAATGCPKRLHYVSSLAIFGQRSAPERIDERTNADGERHPPGRGYSASKWVADRLVRAAIEMGADCTVYRLARAAGDSASGHASLDDMFYRLLSSCVQMGAYPAGDALTTNLLPVDVVARAIVRIALGRPDARIYHVHNPHHTTVEEFMQVFNERSTGTAQPEALPDWVRRLRMCADRGQDLPILPYLLQLEDLAAGRGGSQAEFDNQRTQDVLRDRGVLLPRVDQTLIRKYWTYLDPQSAGGPRRPHGRHVRATGTMESAS